MVLRRPLIVGNWKMNGLTSSQSELQAIVKGMSVAPAYIDAAICPPFLRIPDFVRMAQGSRVLIGAQDCHTQTSGAHTGDISAALLADSGAKLVIVGHSERRMDHHETDSLVRDKAIAALSANVMVIVCIGETEAERDAGQTLSVVKRQLTGSIPDHAKASTVIVAYEPVWAIGTGRTPTAAEVAQVHGAIRHTLETRLGAEGKAMRILYGGSVKPGNALELLAIDNVDGALVGGASLKATDFMGIVAGVPVH